MSTLTFVNIPSWVPDQVVNWLRGLDDLLLPYVPLFLNAGITGKQLLLLTHTDLRDMGIFKLGHRELILEAVEMLHSVYYDLETQTVQSLALQLSCKAISLRNDVIARLSAVLSGNPNVIESQGKIPLSILTAVSDVVATIKQLVSWLDRAPFDTSDEYVAKRDTLISHGMELLDGTQKDHPLECEKEIMDKCRVLAEFGDRIIQRSKDSLVIQPVSLEITTIRKKPEDDLGMHIQSLYNGVHIIGGINDQSPADLCGKVEEGDEVVQVNYQTVVGWHLTKLVAALKDNKKEVTLTLKKRPRHVNPFGPNTHRKKVPKNVKQSTFPKAFRRKSREEKGGRAPLKDFLNTMPVPLSKDSSQEPDSDNENEVFQTTTATAPCLLPLPLETGKQRRATVSGGSPPSGKRNSLEIAELSGNSRPKSYTIGSPTSDVVSLLGSPGSDLMSPKFLEELNQREKSPSKEGILTLGGVTTTSSKDSGSLSPTDKTVRALADPPAANPEAGMTTLTLTPPNTSEATLIMNAPQMKQSLSDNNLQMKLLVETPNRRRKSSDTTGVVAKAYEERGSPQLLRITRINSKRRAEMHERSSSDEQDAFVTEEKLRSRPLAPVIDNVDDHSSNFSQSYTVNIVGGVAQKVPTKDVKESPQQSPSGLLRRKHIMKHMGAHRRISCKDLGVGECQGWLLKKKEHGVFHGKWVKRWFVLKEKNLFFYKGEEDDKAKGVIHLPGFQISPAPESKQKFAFKAFHDGTTFMFASDRQEDMAKWMNKMGLVAIEAVGVRKPIRDMHLPPRDDRTTYYSESEDEGDSMVSGRTSPSSPSTPRRGSPSSSIENLSGSPEHRKDELVVRFSNLREKDLAIDGHSTKNKRISSISKPAELSIQNPHEVEKYRKWDSLQRTLKVKESELALIEELLQSDPITSALLAAFREDHPYIMEIIREDLADHGSSDGSIRESDDL